MSDASAPKSVPPPLQNVCSLIFEQFAWACPTTSAYLTIHNMVCGMIDQFGTDEQKAQWLPDMVAGKKLGSYCLTEPGSGSDSAALKTTAKREGDEYVINGEKVFISGAGATDVYAVMVCRVPVTPVMLQSGVAPPAYRCDGIVTRSAHGTVMRGVHHHTRNRQQSVTKAVYSSLLRAFILLRCFCPVGVPPTPAPACLPSSHSQDSEVWSVLTTTDVGNALAGAGQLVWLWKLWIERETLGGDRPLGCGACSIGPSGEVAEGRG